MTAKATAVPAFYGMREISGLYQKYASIGLMVAILFHLLLIGIYYCVGYFKIEDKSIIWVRRTICIFPPPPPIDGFEGMLPINVHLPIVKPSVGIPIPVPDPEVRPDQSFASQKELSEIQNQLLPTWKDGDQVNFQKELKLEDEAPPDFVPIEVPPVPINEIKPEYPEVARSAKMEGTVWVKMWVSKEGKVKKAVVLKSDADVFNESAINAAMLYIFKPAMMNNGPVAVWASMPFRFKLTK